MNPAVPRVPVRAAGPRGGRRWLLALGLALASVAALGQQPEGLHRTALDQAEAALQAGQLDSGRKALLRALAQSPADAAQAYRERMLLGDLFTALQDPEGARSAYTAALRIAGDLDTQRQDRARQRLAELDRPLRWRAHVDSFGADYTGTRGSEWGLQVQGVYRASERTQFSLGAAQTQAFDGSDQALRAGLSLRPLDALTLAASVAAVPDASFSSDRQLRLRADLIAHDVLQPYLDYRWLRYDDDSVRIWTPGVYLAFDSGWGVDAQHAMAREIDGTHTALTTLRVERGVYWGAARSLWVSGTRGDEGLPPQSLADVRRYAAGVSGHGSARWDWRLSLEREIRKDVHRAWLLGLGLSWRF